MAAMFEVFVDEDHIKLPTLYWLPKLHKRPYKLRFIANSSSVHVQLPSCLLFRDLASLRLKTMSLNLAQQFIKGRVKIYFDLLKIR